MDYKQDDIRNVLGLFRVDNFTYHEIYDREALSAVAGKWPLLKEILQCKTKVLPGTVK